MATRRPWWRASGPSGWLKSPPELIKNQNLTRQKTTKLKGSRDRSTSIRDVNEVKVLVLRASKGYSANEIVLSTLSSRRRLSLAYTSPLTDRF